MFLLRRWELHFLLNPFYNPPSHVPDAPPRWAPTRHNPTFMKMFAPARKSWDTFIREVVSKPKVENVVYPPNIPMKRRPLTFGERYPLSMNRKNNNTRGNAPEKLTKNVPQGKSPSVKSPETSYLSPSPNALPAITSTTNRNLPRFISRLTFQDSLRGLPQRCRSHQPWERYFEAGFITRLGDSRE